jgi:antitoxin component YwqK of YwqJK toxin-antitoxin module
MKNIVKLFLLFIGVLMQCFAFAQTKTPKPTKPVPAKATTTKDTEKVSTKSFKLNADGDTINKIDSKDRKQGKWVITKEPLRGNPGYEEEGIYKDNLKEGVFRKYSTDGDILGYETFLHDAKEGSQQYYTNLGVLEREESWRAFNPEHPNDTIPIYGTGSGEIIEYKIQKAVPYSVKHGVWKYYNPVNGELLVTETWDRNVKVVPKPKETTVASTGKSLDGVKKKVAKTPEMLEWERKNKGKKVIKNGATTL